MVFAGYSRGIVNVDPFTTSDVEVAAEPYGEGIVLVMQVQGIQEGLVPFKGDDFSTGPFGIFMSRRILPDFNQVRFTFEGGVEFEDPVNKVFRLLHLE